MTHNSVRLGRGTQSTEASSLHQKGLAHLSPGPSVRCTTMAFHRETLSKPKRCRHHSSRDGRYYGCYEAHFAAIATVVATRFSHSPYRPRFWCSSRRTWATLCSFRTSGPLGVLFYCSISSISKGKLGSESKVLCRGGGLWLGVRMLLLFLGALRALETSLMRWPSAREAFNCRFDYLEVHG